MGTRGAFSPKLPELSVSRRGFLRLLGGGVGLTVAGSLLASCKSTASTGGSGAQTSIDKIRVGAVLPLTGAFSASGQYFQQGYQLATDERNQQGGLTLAKQKVPIELRILDDGSDASKSRSLVEQLATQEKVNALLGGYDTSLVQAQQAVPDQYKLPMVEGGGAASAIFDRGNKYLFGTLATIDILGDDTMQFLKYWLDQGKLPKPLKIALAWENTDHGKDYHSAVQKAAKDNSGYFQVVLDQSFDLNGSDFTPLLTQVKAANADAFLSDAHLPDFITMHRQYTQLGLKHKFITYGARGPDQKGREALGATADGLVAGLWWTPALTAPESQQFTEKWKSKFNVTPDWFQALAYDTTRVLFAAIENAGTLDSAKLRDALAGLDFTGSLVPGGRITFDAKGKPKTTFVFTQNLPGNKVAIVWPRDLAGYVPATLPIQGG